MATLSNDEIYIERRGRMSPVFVLLLALLVLIAFALVLQNFYGEGKKALFLAAALFIGIFGLFAVRDVKPYLFFSMIMATSLNVDFFFHLEETTSFHATSGYYFHIIFFPIIVLWFIHLSGVFTGDKKFTLRHSSVLPLFVFILMAVLSVQNSPEPEFGGYELYSLAFGVLLYLLLTNAIERKKEIFFIIIAIAVSVLLQGIIAGAQYAKGGMLGLRFLGEAEKMLVDTSLSEAVRRASGTLGYPNSLALYLDLFLPPIVGMALVTRNGLYKLLFIFSALLGLMSAVLTVSRAGIAAAILSTLLVIMFWALRKKIIFRTLIILALCSAIVFAGILLTENPIKSRLFQQGDNSASSRVPMMEVAQDVISNNLIFGVGLNNYTDVAPKYDSTSIRISTVFPFPVHNTPLLILAEIGLIGFIGLSIFLVLTIGKGFMLAFDRNIDFAILGFSFSIGIVIFMVHTLVDYTYLSSDFSFWLVCGLIAGIYSLRKKTRTV
jgi:putative inorganic carbon (HCO3(-)) transporter